MTKSETLDCVDVKIRAQRPLTKALAAKSPEEQAQLLRRLAAQLPLWKSLGKAQPKGVRPRGKRSTGWARRRSRYRQSPAATKAAQ